MRDRRPTLLALLFGLREPIDRRTYALAGFGLMAVKYGLDASLIYVTTGRFFSPLDFFNPLFSAREAAVGKSHALLGALALCALPFLWTGISMSFRRCIDAGLSPWLSLLFLVPGVNYLFMLAMCIARPRTPVEAAVSEEKHSAFASALLGAGASVALACVMAVISIYALKGYGSSLFFGTPLLMGAVSAHIFNRRRARSMGMTIAVGATAVIVTGLSALLFMIEGAVCIFMAAPLAVAAAVLGSIIGRAMTVATQATAAALVVLALSLPLIAWAETRRTSTEHAVTTSVRVSAPPKVVFEHVIHFPELPPPTSAWFKAGVAYPKRARIVGTGVGAVRHCEFSTGPFVEPITVWDAPNRLAFNVTTQPRPMQEWSPYGAIEAPHLDDYFRSVRGEFRLTRLEDGSTQLDGTTWYQLDIHPRVYWSLWADSLVHEIHGEVLAHVKSLAEKRPR